MTKILVVHGSGMNMRGKSQVEVFGPKTLADYDEQIKRYASDLEVEVEIFHSNIAGEVINRFYAGHEDGVDGALFNPAGYTTGHPAIVAAIGQVGYPTYEIHISNPASRGGVSQIAPACRGVIAGCGLFGYYLGMRAVLDSASG